MEETVRSAYNKNSRDEISSFYIKTQIITKIHILIDIKHILIEDI